MTDAAPSTPPVVGAGSAPRHPAATVALTCWWACVITAGLAVLAAVAIALQDQGAAWILVIVWVCVAALTWVVGWPAGYLAEACSPVRRCRALDAR